jgi:DNA-binding response OmpR family regulator
MKDMKILVVDDDKDIRKIIRIYLEQQGYIIIEAEDGLDALDKVDDSYDLVILDVMMPNLDGIETCRRIRENYAMPIIFLTAKSEEMDKVEGFSVGADDYIPKPFTPLELIARVRANLRRYLEYGSNKIEENSNIIELENLIIDTAAHLVTKKGVEVPLTKTEFGILSLLAANRGKVYSLDEIYTNVWGENSILSAESTVSVHVKKLRQKIEDDIKKPRYVKTVWGVGYRVD